MLKKYLEILKFYTKTFGISKYLVLKNTKIYTRKNVVSNLRYFSKDSKISLKLKYIYSTFNINELYIALLATPSILI